MCKQQACWRARCAMCTRARESPGKSRGVGADEPRSQQSSACFKHRPTAAVRRLPRRTGKLLVVGCFVGGGFCGSWFVGFSGCCLCVCMVIIVVVTIHSAFRSALYPAHLDASHAGFVRRVEREESVVAGQYRAAADTRTAGVDTRHRGALQVC